MKKFRLDKMTRGWIVGDFDPAVLKTKDCEVGYKIYKAGDTEDAHYHKVATELTLVTKGIITLNGIKYSEGDIAVIEPGEIVKFRSVTDAENVVFKIPSVKGDKYIVEGT